MKKNKAWVQRRIIEAIVISLVSSFVIYMLVIMQIIPSTYKGYVGGFGCAALIFLILNYIVLYAHFWAVKFNLLTYAAVNLSIFAFMVFINLIGLRCFSDNIYTLIFGYTKPFRQILKLTPVCSAALFWVIYLVLMAFVPIKIFYFDSNYKRWRIKKANYEADKLKDITFMEDKN